MIDVLDRFEVIRRALNAGHKAVVQVVRDDAGDLHIQWGAAGVEPLLRLNSLEDARVFAGVLEAADYMPEIAEMLTEACDAAERLGATIQ